MARDGCQTARAEIHSEKVEINMILHDGDPDSNPRDDYVGHHEAAALVSLGELRFLLRHSYLTGLDGLPCWERKHFDELLQTYSAEGE